MPEVGDCYDLPPAQVADPLVSPGPVECTAPHDAETVFVLATALDHEQDYPRHVAETPSGPVLGSGDGDDGRPGNPVSSSLSAVCNGHLVTSYLGGDDSAAMDYVFADFAARLPSEHDWAAGARWVRCDAVYGYGAAQAAPGLMRKALERPDAASFRLCLGLQLTGALPLVPCSSPHQAEVIGTFPDVSTDTPYPATVEARQALAADLCGDTVNQYVRGELPADYVVDLWVGAPEHWSGGWMPCVVSRADGGTTTTSVVAPLG
jgi:hypothetical protein